MMRQRTHLQSCDSDRPLRGNSRVRRWIWTRCFLMLLADVTRGKFPTLCNEQSKCFVLSNQRRRGSSPRRYRRPRYFESSSNHRQSRDKSRLHRIALSTITTIVVSGEYLFGERNLSSRRSLSIALATRDHEDSTKTRRRLDGDSTETRRSGNFTIGSTSAQLSSSTRVKSEIRIIECSFETIARDNRKR